MSDKNIFKILDDNSDKILVCPDCYETLLRADIEHYERCPYCNYKLEFDIEIEDYILQPVINQWVNALKKQTSDSNIRNTYL